MKKNTFRTVIRPLGMILILLVISVGCTALQKDLSSPSQQETEMAENGQSQTGAPASEENRTVEDSREQTPADILQGYDYAPVDLPSEDFELEDLAGNKIRLTDLQGKTVFLNFWATWCPPCRDEMPHMQVFYDRYKEDDVVVLAISPTTVENRGGGDSDRAERAVRAFIETYGFTFPVLLDRDDAVWSVYQQRGIPANYIIDPQGQVRYLKPGAFLSVEEMEAFLEAARR